jgi:hypothetical protein
MANEMMRIIGVCSKTDVRHKWRAWKVKTRIKMILHSVDFINP